MLYVIVLYIILFFIKLTFIIYNSIINLIVEIIPIYNKAFIALYNKLSLIYKVKNLLLYYSALSF